MPSHQITTEHLEPVATFYGDVPRVGESVEKNQEVYLVARVEWHVGSGESWATVYVKRTESR